MIAALLTLSTIALGDIDTIHAAEQPEIVNERTIESRKPKTLSAERAMKLGCSDQMEEEVNDAYPELKDWYQGEHFYFHQKSTFTPLRHGTVDIDENSII